MYTKSSKKINEIAGFSKEKLLEMNKLCQVADILNILNKSDIKQLKSTIVKGPDNVIKIKKDDKYEERFKFYGDVLNEGYEIIPFKQNNIKNKKIPLPSYQEKDCVGCVCIKGKELTIVYRGTKNLYDIAHDLNISNISWPGSKLKGEVHQGFYSSFCDSLYSVQEILIEKGVLINYNEKSPATANPNTDYKINFIGHSLGGAVAQIAALHFHNLGVKNISVATFGSPRVFDTTLSKKYNDEVGMVSIRVENRTDIVPDLIPKLLNFSHAGTGLILPVRFGGHDLSQYRKGIDSIQKDKFNPYLANIYVKDEKMLKKLKLQHDSLNSPGIYKKFTVPDNRSLFEEKRKKISSDVSTELNNVNVKESKISPVK